MADDAEFDGTTHELAEESRLHLGEAPKANPDENFQRALTPAERAGIALIKEEILEEPFVNFRLYPYPYKGEERSYFIRPQYSPAVLEARRARADERSGWSDADDKRTVGSRIAVNSLPAALRAGVRQIDPLTLNDSAGKTDMTSYLHKMAELYTSLYAEVADVAHGSSRVLDDFDDLTRWMKIGDSSLWYVMTPTLRYECLRPFAVVCERYLLRGEAPFESAKSTKRETFAGSTHAMFDQFIHWLKLAYRAVRDNFNVYYRTENGKDLPFLLSEAAKEMERLLARDVLISKAELHYFDIKPIFGSRTRSGMNELDWRKYLQLTIAATDFSAAELSRITAEAKTKAGTNHGMGEAMERAIFNEARARMIAFEMRYAFKKSERQWGLIGAAQKIARMSIACQKFSEIDPKMHAAETIYWKRKAWFANVHGDHEALGDAKRWQLLQHMMVAEALKVKAEGAHCKPEVAEAETISLEEEMATQCAILGLSTFSPMDLFQKRADDRYTGIENFGGWAV